MNLTKRWPFLEKAGFDYVDLALAKQLQAPNEAVAALVCYLSLAAREGHLCVRIQEELSPSIAQLLDADLPQLEALIKEGSQSPPQGVVQSGDRFYFQRYWAQETAALTHFRQLKKSVPKIKIDLDPNRLKSHKLLPEQAQAILQAASQSFTIICGGPGTGKTYTAAILLELFLEAIEGPCEVALAAPTGKAAANLQKNMRPGLPAAKTLHSLLGIKRKSKSSAKLSADIILVDECSMIDASLMGQLLAAIKPGARLIFLGDKHQLPPVEAGSLFSDMIAACPDCVVSLKTCMRSELEEIVTFSHKINQGDAASVLQMLQSGHAISRSTSDPLSLDRFPLTEDPIAAMQAFNQFRLLSPLRKGPLGVDQVNRRIFTQLMAKKPRNQPAILPIMLASNESRLELFNGETGILVQHGDLVQEGDYALFPSKQGIRRVPALLLPKYEYAYCLSVHKSQGSEFDTVLLLLPEGSQHFGREVLYTAATRARKSLHIHGSDDVLAATLKTTGSRLSGFSKRFLEESWI